MGDVTYTNFQAYLKYNLGNDDRLDTYGSIWVNAAYRHLTSMRRWKGRRVWFSELETSTSSNTTDGTAYVATPSDALFVRRVFDDTSNRKLTKIDHDDDYVGYEDRDTATAEGEPREWARSGANIYLYPTPDDTYAMTIYYRKRPTALSAGGDKTAIGAEWDEPILMLASYQSAVRLNDINRYKVFKEEYESMMDNLVGIYDIEDLDKESTMFPDSAWLTNKY